MRDTDFRVSELQRKLLGLIFVGEVKKFDGKTMMASVVSGDVETEMLPVMVRNTRGTKESYPLSEGENVVVVCPEGDPDAGIILGCLHTTETDTKRETFYREFEDGTSIEYDPKKHHMNVEVHGENASLTVNVKSGSVNLTAQRVSIAAEEGVTLNSAVPVDPETGRGVVDPTEGVVTGKCVCAYTGAPHAHVSTKVRAGL